MGSTLAAGVKSLEDALSRRAGKRVVQCHGCFDLLHIGHIRHLEAAKAAGDILIVTITADRYVNKGPHRPAFSDVLRAEAVAALECVDGVAILEHPTASEAIRVIQPSVFAKGPDYAGGLHPDEQRALDDVGGWLYITQTEKWSSTALLNRDAGLSDEAQRYLAELRTTYRAADVRRYLDRARALQVLVIGDAIRDEYEYVNALGKSGKDPILAVEYVRADVFAGGVDAVAQHVRAVSDAVSCVAGSALTVKRRTVEQYPFYKHIEVYRTEPMPDVFRMAEAVSPNEIRQADLVIVADYGHGALTPDLIDRVMARAKCLAVNVQANAGNHGFNTISKYPRADFVSVSERELRLDARDQTSSVRRLMARRNGTTLVTRGAHGCIVGDHGGFAEAPALTTHVVDRTGAGDAVFAVTACCAAVGMPVDLLACMASLVGTQAVGIVGNARYIERGSLWQAVEQALG